MKKLVMFLFVMLIAFTLTGCNNKEKEDDVDYAKVNEIMDTIDNLYQNIKDLDFEDENVLHEIDKVNTLYKDLTQEEKDAVENYVLFEDVLSAYDKFQADKDAILQEEKEKREAIKEAMTNLDETLPTKTNKNTITLPYNYITKGGVKVYISWITSDPQTINTNGVITRPRIKDKDVKLTATLKIGDIKEEYSKTVTVEFLEYTKLPKKPVFAYYYQGATNLNEIESETIDVINLAFGTIGENNGKISVGNLNTEALLKEREKGIRVVFSVQDKAGFQKWTKDDNSRRVLANSFVDTVQKYHFDGVDIDWEYPVGEEIANYTEFLRLLKTRLKKASNEYLVTSAVYGGQGSSKYNIKKSHEYLDYVLLMTYDLNDPNSTDHLTPLGPTTYQTNNYGSVVGTLKDYLGAKVPKEKLVIGAAFYGKVYELPLDSRPIGLYMRPVKEAKTINYSQIKKLYLDKIGKDPNLKIEKKFDEKENAYYLAITEYENGTVTSKKFITYDDPESIKQKSEYVFSQGLGGIMFWELGSTDRVNNDQIKAINSVFSKHKLD